MVALLGDRIPLDCPACGEPTTVPIRQLGVDEQTVTVALDLGPFRAHVQTAHGDAQPRDGDQ